MLKQKIVAVKANSSGKRIVYYDGRLVDFATEILERGRGNGTVCRICTVASEIVMDMRERGETLESNDIIVTQKEVFKYRHHPKAKKGANLPIEDYVLIEKALCSPIHIYEDKVQKRHVYVCTHPYQSNKLVKVVVEPNFKNHGKVVNIAKSWGIVESCKMKAPQFRVVK